MNEQSLFHRDKRLWSNLGIATGFSVASAIGLGVVGLAHKIRDYFYHSVIRGFNESPTVFTPIIEKYTHSTTGVFAQSLGELQRGTITGAEHLAKNRTLASNFNNEIADLLQKTYDIPTKGIPGWTIGSWKRFQQLSTQGMVGSTLTFASLAATAVGAVFVLKHSLDRSNDEASSR
ncbi:MAG: hypothetical protein ACOYNL_05175 [Rickettsiales bacterium]